MIPTVRPGQGRAAARGHGRDPGLHGFMTPFALQAARELCAEGLRSICFTTRREAVRREDLVECAADGRGGHGREPEHHRRAWWGRLRGVERAHPSGQAAGHPRQFGEVATEDYLFNKHGFGLEHIAKACRELVRANT